MLKLCKNPLACNEHLRGFLLNAFKNSWSGVRYDEREKGTMN